ncbi:hypothetical protein [Nostoc sp. C117]|uniref:hypothetical protein n=1 Tax=Nostoc sp. C117 TaxID=3349875 RepID=UPI00370D2E22
MEGRAIAQPSPVPIKVPDAKTPTISPTPTTSPQPTTGENSDTPDETPDETTQEEEQPQEDLSPEEAQQADQESDSKLPKPEQNPFKKPSIDMILEKEMNDDMWRLLRGGLPCLETSATCLQQLQEKAITQSPLLKEIDARIAEANERINEAKIRNKKAIQLSILTPGLQYLLGPAPTAGQPQKGNGLIDNLSAIFRGDIGIINGLLNVIGIPFFQGTQGGNADAQRNAIAISDIQVKVAELQRSRAQLADTIRDKVAQSLIAFDEARTDFQTAQVVASRAVDQFKVFEIRYRRGNSDTDTYLLRQNTLDNTKAQTYRAWAKMRRSLFTIKLLVLSIKDAEI